MCTMCKYTNSHIDLRHEPVDSTENFSKKMQKMFVSVDFSAKRVVLFIYLFLIVKSFHS